MLSVRCSSGVRKEPVFAVAPKTIGPMTARRVRARAKSRVEMEKAGAGAVTETGIVDIAR